MMGCTQTTYPSPCSRKSIIQKPKNVDPSPIIKKSVCRTLPDGSGCMVPPHLLPVSDLEYNWEDPRRKLYESLFPAESPYRFEGDPDYDWGVFYPVADYSVNPRKFTYEQPDATSVGPLKLLAHPVAVDQVMTPASVCPASGVDPPLLSCHAQSHSPASCPRLFVQEQIFRGDCSSLPRRRHLLLEGCTAEFDRPGSVNPFTKHFTPAMKYPPEFFQMRNYLAEKALDRGVDYSTFISFRNNNRPSICPGDVPAMAHKLSLSRKDEKEGEKPCKRQAAYLSTNRPLSTYYEPRDKEWLDKLGDSKWKTIRENLTKIRNMRNRSKNNFNRRNSRTKPLSRKDGKYERDVFRKEQICRSNRCKSAYVNSGQKEEENDHDDSHLRTNRFGHRDASDSTNIRTNKINEGSSKTEPSVCCEQYPPSIHQTKLEWESKGLTRCFSTSGSSRVRADYFENCDEQCALRERYRRAHILSLDHWASDPKREFHVRRSDAPPTPAERHSAPGSQRSSQRRLPTICKWPDVEIAPSNCDDNCLHGGCFLKPGGDACPRKLSIFSARNESDVGKPKKPCKLSDKIEIDCFPCMKSGCLKNRHVTEKDNTPCLLKDLEAQDKERRKRKPSCHFEGPKVFKPHKIPLSESRDSSTIGNVPYVSMYKYTPHIDTEDDILIRDLAWLRGKISTLLSGFKKCDTMHTKRSESSVGRVPPEKKPKLLNTDVCMTCLVENDCNEPRLNYSKRKFLRNALQENQICKRKVKKASSPPTDSASRNMKPTSLSSHSITSHTSTEAKHSRHDRQHLHDTHS